AAGTRAWLMRCASESDAWFGHGAWQEPLGDRVRQTLGLPADAGPDTLATLCADNVFDPAPLKRCLDACNTWGTTSGLGIAAAIEQWLAASPLERAGGLAALRKGVFTEKGTVKFLNNLVKHDPDYGSYCEEVLASL